MEELGATGKFPQGKLNPEDQGELRFGVASDEATNRVIVNLGQPVIWFAMDPGLARELAKVLVIHADALDAIPKAVT